MAEAGKNAAEDPDSRAATETEETTAGVSAPEVPPRRGPVAGFRTGLVVAVVFLLGLTLGAVAVGLLGDSAPPPTAIQADAGPEGRGLIAADLDPEAGPFQVNGACLGAFNAAQDAYATIDDLGQAASALDAAQLDEVVRRLQPLQQQLEDDLAACRVTEIDDPSRESSTPGTSSTPRSTATPSPTD